MRPGAELDRRQLDRIVYGLGRWLDWVPMDPIDLSASELRDRMRAREDVSDDVPLAVLSYAREQQLYE